MQQIPAGRDAIADATRAVFASSGDGTRWYDSIVHWIDQGFRWLAAHPRLTSWTLTAILAVMLAAMLGGAAYHAWLARRGPDALRAGARPGRGPELDARALAARGDFLGAAHALYGTVLDALGQRGRVVLHPSKTSGDYFEELRSRGPAAAPRFAAFAREYERTVYRQDACDDRAYARLQAMADAVGHADA